MLINRIAMLYFINLIDRLASSELVGAWVVVVDSKESQQSMAQLLCNRKRKNDDKNNNNTTTTSSSSSSSSSSTTTTTSSSNDNGSSNDINNNSNNTDIRSVKGRKPRGTKGLQGVVTAVSEHCYYITTSRMVLEARHDPSPCPPTEGNIEYQTDEVSSSSSSSSMDVVDDGGDSSSSSSSSSSTGSHQKLQYVATSGHDDDGLNKDKDKNEDKMSSTKPPKKELIAGADNHKLEWVRRMVVVRVLKATSVIAVPLPVPLMKGDKAPSNNYNSNNNSSSSRPSILPQQQQQQQQRICLLYGEKCVPSYQQ